jgi:hypothetical protein
MKNSFHNPRFDTYAENYDSLLDEALSVSGEDKTYFAQARIAWMSDCVRQLQDRPESILDYGCGIGTATPFLCNLIGAEFLIV